MYGRITRGRAFFWLRWDAKTEQGKRELADMVTATPDFDLSGVESLAMNYQYDCDKERQTLISQRLLNRHSHDLFAQTFTGPDLTWMAVPGNKGELTNPRRIAFDAACAKLPYTTADIGIDAMGIPADADRAIYRTLGAKLP